MKNSIYQEGGELDTPTTLWFCENLPLWEGFILCFGPAYGWAGWNHYLIKLWTIYLYSKTPPKVLHACTFFTRTSLSETFVAGQGVSTTSTVISAAMDMLLRSATPTALEDATAAAAMMAVWKRRWECHGVLMNWSFSPHIFDDSKGCMMHGSCFATLPPETSFLERVWECPSPTNHGR